MQIFSILTLVNHNYPIIMNGNTFERNIGTKGIIFITGTLDEADSYKSI